MTSAEANASRLFAVEQLRVPHPFEAYLLRVSGFPIEEPDLSRLRTFLKDLTNTVAVGNSVRHETFLQVLQLHLGDAAKRITRHGKDWVPMLGLGVWPDRDPPTFWTAKDFEDLTEGEQPRPLMHQVLRVTTSPAAKRDCFERMLGFGATLHVASLGAGPAFIERAKDLLLGPITEDAFRGFPFYAPLLEMRSVQGAKQHQFESWLCGASLYIRESVEDNGILIIASEPLYPVIKAFGSIQSQTRAT